MVFGAMIGSLLGGVGGVAVGGALFPNYAPKNYSFLHPDADPDSTIPVPELDSVPAEMADLLQYTATWTKQPEFNKVTMVNRIIKLMWPNYNRAIMQIVRDTAIPIVKQQTQQISVLENVEFKTLDLGDIPLRIGGINHTSTDEDECIIETPILWGSNAKFELVVTLRIASVRIVLPILVKDIQMKTTARVTIKPLVEVMPCLGGVHVSLLDVPHVDFHLSIVKGVDIMAIPGVSQIVHMGLKMGLGSMFLYPNSFSVPLMENYGMVPDPQGVLHVRLIRVEGLKNTERLGTIDPYVVLQVRENRSVRTKTVDNTIKPEYNEEFHLVVDDPLTQRLHLTVYNDEGGWQDERLCEGYVWLWEKKDHAEKDPVTRRIKKEDRQPKEFIRMLGVKSMTVQLYAQPPKPRLSFLPGKGKKKAATEADDEEKPPPNGKECGLATLELKFIPFSVSNVDDDADDADEKEKAAAAAAITRRPTMRAVQHNITNLQKGLLTVTLVRGFNLGDGRDADPYVKFTLVDSDSAMDDVVQQSTILFNEPNPQWREKFDFTMVSAGSVLLINVYDKGTIGENLNPLKIHKALSKPQDAFIGRLRIPVLDVAKNGRLRDNYFLREVDQGHLELIFKWQSLNIREDV